MTNSDGARPTRWPLVRFAAYAAAILAAVVLATIATRVIVPPEPSPWHDMVWVKNIVLPVALLCIYAALVRVMERRPAREVDPRRGFPTFLLGLVIGAAIIGATYFILQKLGMVTVSEGTGFDGLGRALIVPMVTSMGEELLFRVILFGLLEEIAGSLVAIVLSSAAFGLAHLGNAGATPMAIFALSVELGVMASLAYMLTRNIWIAVGIHAAWNFMQGFVIGAQNSGEREPFNYVRSTFTGPELLTGGGFGLEGSVVTLGLSVVVSFVLLLLIARAKRWQRVRFRLGSPPQIPAP